MVLRTTDVKQAKDNAEYMTDERCYITEVANDGLDDNLSIAIARVKPGIATAWHRLQDTSERYLIIAGSGRVELDPDFGIGINSGQLLSDERSKISQEVVTGDVVRIAPGVSQRIINTASVDLVFYAVCTPRFMIENYISLE